MVTVTFRRNLHMGDTRGVVRLDRGTPVELVSALPDGPNVVNLVVRSGDRTLSRALFISEVRNLISVHTGGES